MTNRNILLILLTLFASRAMLFGQKSPQLLPSAFKSGFSSTEAFLVNDDSGSGCQQAFPVVAGDGNGGFVVAWADQRNGRPGNWGGSYYYRGWDIFFQRFDAAGNPFGPNQKVNDNTGYLTLNSDHPLAIAMNTSGQFVVVWEDIRPDPDAKRDLYFQIFDAQGNPQGANQKANEDDETDRQESPAVVMDEQGGFIIAWQNMGEYWSDMKILFRKFAADGNPLGSSQIVNPGDTPLWTSQGGPVIAMDASGRFAISWIGQLTGNWSADILVQRFDAAANPLGPAQTVNDDTAHCEQASPVLAMNERGDFIIAWEDARFSNGADVDYFDVFYQRFDSNGVALGGNVMANDDAPGAGQFHPGAAINTDGKVTIVWHDNRVNRATDGVYYQQYDNAGNALGVNRKADLSDAAFPQSMPGLFMDNAGQFIITWQDDREGALNRDIYFQQYDAAGNARAVAHKVNDDTGSTDQAQPAVAMDGKGGYIIAWTDERNSYQQPYQTYDIYFQQYDAAGNPVGPNRQVNDNAGRISDPTTPCVAADADGNFVIAWMDNRTHSWDIYCQRYNAAGQALGHNIMVNDDNNYDSDERSPAIAMNSNGDYVIAWTYYSGFSHGIQYQVFDEDGHWIGGNQSSVYSNGGDWPAIATDDSGRFAISWYVDAYYDINGEVTIITDVYLQRFDAAGNSLGKANKVNNVAEGKRGGAAMAMNKSGELVIAWPDGRNGFKDVYYQRYDNNGNPVGTNQKANDTAAIAAPYSPVVVVNESGEFVIIWADERMQVQSAALIGQAFKTDGSPNGDNFFVNNGLCECFPAAATNGDKILFAWQDNRRAKGFDIYGKSVDWDEANAVYEEDVLPQNHALLPNYPNPFNPETVIPYQLYMPGQVNINIVNIMGQHVCDLVNLKQETGSHQVIWNGTDKRGFRVNSGVYFCRMQVQSNGSKYQATRKICLVK